ncbi:DUF7691 family protein [Streptomyces kaniharaensis]
MSGHEFLPAPVPDRPRGEAPARRRRRRVPARRAQPEFGTSLAAADREFASEIADGAPPAHEALRALVQGGPSTPIGSTQHAPARRFMLRGGRVIDGTLSGRRAPRPSVSAQRSGVVLAPATRAVAICRGCGP